MIIGLSKIQSLDKIIMFLIPFIFCYFVVSFIFKFAKTGVLYLTLIALYIIPFYFITYFIGGFYNIIIFTFYLISNFMFLYFITKSMFKKNKLKQKMVNI